MTTTSTPLLLAPRPAAPEAPRAPGAALELRMTPAAVCRRPCAPGASPLSEIAPELLKIVLVAEHGHEAGEVGHQDVGRPIAVRGHPDEGVELAVAGLRPGMGGALQINGLGGEHVH